MPLSKAQIKKSLADGKRVLCREIVSEQVWLESCFEDDWSRLIRTGQVPSHRGLLYEKWLAVFRSKVAAEEITEGNVRSWLRSIFTVEIADSR